MPRKVARSLTQLVFFLIVFFLILYVNRPSSSPPTFAWTKVRYRTTAPSLPPVRGKCPHLAKSKKPALIVSHVDADGETSWLTSLQDRYHICLYDVDGPRANEKPSETLQVPANRGHEAMAYLTFLIDNYENIPAAGAVFVHGSRWAWHNDAPDYDNKALLAALNIERALEAGSGYHNLRCDWSTSTCLASAPAQGSLELQLQSITSPWSARTASDVGLPRALTAIFGGGSPGIKEGSLTGRTELGRTEKIRAQCCAQFVVSRERIWQHTRDEYIALRQWLLDGSGGADGGKMRSRNDPAAPSNDKVAGRILSYMWHILFAKPDANGMVDLERLNRDACPDAKECYCRLYGRCDLRCPGPETCLGQYKIPKNFQLPDNWEATHG